MSAKSKPAETELNRLVAKARRNLAGEGLRTPDSRRPRRRLSRIVTLTSKIAAMRPGFLLESALAVHRPDTPRPWLHLLGSNHDNVYGVVGSFWDVTGLGFLCYESVLAGAVTSHKDSSYVPTAPRSTDVRQFFLREEADGQPRLWDMLPQVGREPEKYSDYDARYGLGWISVESTRHKIHSHLRVFVPVDDACEVWTITLTNRSDRPRKLQLFTRVNWGLESHPSYYFDPRVTSLGVHRPDLRAIVALNRHLGNALPRAGFMMSSAPFRGFDLSGEEFTGGGHFARFPRAVVEGNCRNSLGLQPYAGLVGALQFDLTLAPGASRTLHILVGRTEREEAEYTRHLKSLSKTLLRRLRRRERVRAPRRPPGRSKWAACCCRARTRKWTAPTTFG